MKKNIGLLDNIAKLKSQKDAIILAHNYQIGEVQDIADFTGDSLQLSIEASKVKQGMIVFCGVNFMAETAKIISPEKKVLIPDKNSGCPMADMITAKDLAGLKKKHPDAVVVCYVNSTAEVKALSDICCTSSNAVKIIESIDPKKDIIFIPDKYLGSYVSKKTGRDLIFWEGYCPTHVMMSAKKLIEIKKDHLDAELLVHPESTPEVIDMADSVQSTGGMLEYVKGSKRKKFIIGTEIGMLHRLKKENPDKVFISASKKLICPNMKLINVEKIFWSLEEEQYEIKLDENTIKEARSAIDKMLEIT